MEIHSGSLPAEMQAAVALAASDKALYVSYALFQARGLYKGGLST